MKKNLLGFVIATLFFLSACNNNANTAGTSNDSSVAAETPAKDAAFHETVNGKEVSLYRLKNKNNVKAEFTNYGARLVSLFVPDKSGNMVDVTLGYDSISSYTRPGESYFGASIGRYANRIGNAKFKLDGKEYTLPANDRTNTLHGGGKGFDKQVWDAAQKDSQTIVFSYVSKDGEEGFPGNLTAKITYTLKDDNSLQIDYEATTDAKTVCNLTNHSYWNLNGAGSGSIINHEMMINADNILPVDRGLIPTGSMMKVSGTPFDFRQSTVISKGIADTANEQVKLGGGFDHNYVLNNVDGKVNKVAVAKGDITGITMEVYTDQPGLQFYTGNFLNRRIVGKGGKVYDRRNAFCLEAGHYPDSPNKPSFPTTVLEPGKVYKQTTIYKFL